MTTKEQYWKYSLISFILILTVIIFREFLPFLSGLLGASTIYIMVRGQMRYLVEKKKIGNSLAATIILCEVIFCLLIPAFFTIWLLVSQLQSANLNPAELIPKAQHLTDLIQEKTGYDVFNPDNLAKITGFISIALQKMLSEISMFAVNAIVLLFVLYFMLTSSKKMEAYMYDILPFRDDNKKSVTKEIKIMVRSNAIGIPLLAIIQGFIAMIGYLIFGAPNPIIFGFLTCFATLIPLLGTALIWFPLVVYAALSGDWFNAIGLAIYGIVVISNVDNLIRFILQKKLADTHPFITIFGVIIGLTLFGFWGVIFGPLLLSMYVLCFNIYKKEYLDTEKE